MLERETGCAVLTKKSFKCFDGTPSLMPSARRNETETKQFQNCFEIVLFQPKQNANAKAAKIF